MSYGATMPHTIAVLRGGDVSFSQSLVEGEQTLRSLLSHGFFTMDILIDTDGVWTMHGVPTDPHHVFTTASLVIDTTHMKHALYQELASRMGVLILFSNIEDIPITREDRYRILRQHGVAVPDTSVVRSHKQPTGEQLRAIWNTYHTPLMVRPITRTQEISSKIVKGFKEFVETIHQYYEKGIDTHVLTYKSVPSYSLAVLPHFRNQDLYMPLWVKTTPEKAALPTTHSVVDAQSPLSEEEKQDLFNHARKVCTVLDVRHPVCLDFIPTKKGYLVVNVDTNPSLRSDGRFMQSLRTTGVDIGEYVQSYLNQHGVIR